MANDNPSADSQERTYFLSADAAEDMRRSLPLLVFNRQCYMCRDGMSAERAIFESAQYFADAIAEHCSGEADYLLPDTPMEEAIFRTMLASGNARMNPELISDELSLKWAMTQFQRDTSPRVIQRLLDSMAGDGYYCVVSSDSGYEYRQEIGDAREPSKPSPIIKPPPDDEPTICPPITEPTSCEEGAPPDPGPKPEDPGDPFARPSDAYIPPASASPETNERYERLLWWLSARGDGTWAQFRDAAQTLGVADDRGGARSAMRRLVLLAHVDQSEDGLRWSASPTALVRFADGDGGGYVAGARTPSFLSALKRHGALGESPKNTTPARRELISPTPRWATRLS